MVALWVSVSLVGAGCGQPAGDTTTRNDSAPLLELLSWWRAPGEVEALQALTQMYSRLHPGARTFNASAGRATALQNILGERLEAGDPPDLVQMNAREIRQLRQRFPAALESLDGLFDELALRPMVFPELLEDGTSGGHLVALPINFHRENNLFYNQAIFTAHHLTPPRTVAELVALCGTLKAAGITPLALSHQGWILRIMFNAIAAGHMGPAAFRDYFAGTNAAAETQLREALVIFSDLIHRCVNPDAAEPGFGWVNAAQTLFNGDAAMFIHGDWAKGYLTRIGWKPGIDFGVVAAPGNAGLFLYVTDALAVPNGAKNRAGAREFLTMAASPAGQLAFNAVKGSSPIRPDLPMDALDPLARATFSDLQHAQIRMPSPNIDALDVAFTKLVADHDTEAAAQVIAEYVRTIAR
jgi:glucose/mannose transport system substrate-binding protein